MGKACSSLCVSLGCNCIQTGAQKRMAAPGEMNEVAPSGAIGKEGSAILNEYCSKYSIDSSRVAQWLDNHCTTSLITQFIQSDGKGVDNNNSNNNNNNNNNNNSNKALISKENEIDMIILRSRNIDNGFESDAERIDNDNYGNDDKYLTSLGWQMLCNLIEMNNNSLRIIYFEGIFVTKGRMEYLCEKLTKCNVLEEIALVDCSVNFDKDRHVTMIKDESDSQGREIEKRTYDGALIMLQSTKDIDSLLTVKLADKETVSPEFERQIDDLVENIKRRKKRFVFTY